MVFKKATSYFTAVLLLLVIIVTVIIVSIKQTDDLRTINNEITASFEITELADRVLTLSIDNETGARGYLLRS
jgi:CHASE3 domain sensor protein